MKTTTAMSRIKIDKINLATKNEKNTTWVYLTGLLERIIFGIETLPQCWLYLEMQNKKIPHKYTTHSYLVAI